MGEMAQGLLGIDIAIIVVYMVGIFILGTFFGKYVKNAGDFFIAGKALPFWAIGMSIVVSDIGAMDFVGVAGSAYTHGISVANFDWMGSMPAMVFAAFIFVPYFWRSGVFTIPEFLGRRYNAGVQVIHGAIWALFLFSMLSLMLWITADKLMFTILGWNVNFTIWLMVFITGVYTFSGGLSAVVMVDVVQLIIMFVGGIALLVLSMWEVGGWNETRRQVSEQGPKLIIAVDQQAVSDEAVKGAIEKAGFDVTYLQRQQKKLATDPEQFVVRLATINLENVEFTNIIQEIVPLRMHAEERITAELAALVGSAEEARIQSFVTYESHFDILLPHDTYKPYPWSGIVFGLGIVLAIAYMSGNQAVVQRTLGARSEWHAKGGMLFGGFLKSFIPLMVAIPGLTAVVIAPNLANGDTAVPEMIRILLPPGLKGLMFVALFAALISSVDSTLNSAATIWTTDILGRLKQLVSGEPFSGRAALIVGRIFTVGGIVLAGVMAPWFGRHEESVYVWIQTALSLFQGPTLAILLLGVCWRRATRWGGLAGLTLGVAFCFVLNYTDGLFPSEDPFLFVAWWSFIFALVVTVVVSLLTPPEPDEKIRGLVWGQVVKDGEIQRVLDERVSS